MRERLKDYLFGQGYLVCDAQEAGGQEVEALVALGRLFGIRVVRNSQLARLDMVRVAARNLGEHVPAPFYLGFPRSVLELSVRERLLDQLVHYARTYGFGGFSEVGRSVFERNLERACFAEDVVPKDYAIVDEDEAREMLVVAARGFLASSRPLGEAQYLALRAVVDEGWCEVSSCACKDTAIRLLMDTRDLRYATLLALSDVIRLAEQIQHDEYDEADLRHLNLRNRDRKLVVGVLDVLLAQGGANLEACAEKRRLWCGLLHHVHYRPKTDEARAFVRAMRGKEPRSAYAAFEASLAAGDVCGAARGLRKAKGEGAVLRNLDYLLSRCRSVGEADALLAGIATRNKMLLVQLLVHYTLYRTGARRFAFFKFGKVRVHYESPDELAARKSALSPELVDRVRGWVRAQLAKACGGTLGRVYVDEGMRGIALPLRASSSMGGVGTLPCGSRLPLPSGKKLRAFTYWELVDDIDLSAIGLVVNDEGDTVPEEQIEFSWRTMSTRNDGAIVYSGDQTAGFHGGSEYFDVVPSLFCATYPLVRYLVFCDNVYSGSPFDCCLCKAGYMLRDERDSGEVFEPKTVRSSFAVTCKSTFAFLFALDLWRDEFVWLNMAREGSRRVAGAEDVSFLVDALRVTDAIDLHDFAELLATRVVARPEDADVVFSDKTLELPDGTEHIHSHDIARIVELLS